MYIYSSLELITKYGYVEMYIYSSLELINKYVYEVDLKYLLKPPIEGSSLMG